MAIERTNEQSVTFLNILAIAITLLFVAAMIVLMSISASFLRRISHKVRYVISTVVHA